MVPKKRTIVQRIEAATRLLTGVTIRGVDLAVTGTNGADRVTLITDHGRIRFSPNNYETIDVTLAIADTSEVSGEDAARLMAGKTVANAEPSSDGGLLVRFTDGGTLRIRNDTFWLTVFTEQEML